MRFLAVFLVLALGGCALPPIYSVVAYAIDGGMLLVTGKTTTDHGLSMVTGNDCQIWRVVNGREICEDPVILAQAEDAAETPLILEGFNASSLGTLKPVDLSIQWGDTVRGGAAGELKSAARIPPEESRPYP